jgi:hypothetical protein
VERRNNSPFDLPEWHALRREATLVSQLVGVGATALGQASYASGLGHYYTAFFGLSVGIERLAKLVLVAEHILANDGNPPQQSAFRAYGHNLVSLADAVHQVSQKRNLKLKYQRPADAISKAVLDCLNSFASASHGRYANFSALGNANFIATDEPVAKWWREVVEPILDKHYRGKRGERGVRARANAIDALIGQVTSVLHFDEVEGTMTDMATASERTGQSAFAQKYGRFYTLSFARWLMDVFTELTMTAGYQPGLEVLFGHYEFFSAFRNDDSFLLTRKRWPLG